MTVYWYDTEFLEDGKAIELISIGIVADDGREYYAVNSEMPMTRIRKNSWLMENVWNSLPTMGDSSSTEYMDLDWNHSDVKNKLTIAQEVEDFLLGGDSFPELWAWFGAYDHVVLSQLWGRMIDLPRGIPMYTNDLRSLVDWVSAKKLPAQSTGLHNALEDARFNKVRYDYLMELKKNNG